jgi:2-keto-4-pentenoate hydratase/2-oxohepta-3-ene-1,7-dioic acid hydratase in catechol pathway
MTDTLWLARTRIDDRVTTWRGRTDGAAPGPELCWEPIADPFVTARTRREPCDVTSLLATAAALGEPRRLSEPLLPPCSPQTIFGIGRNYKAHAEELGNEVPETPLVFIKAPSCLIASGVPLVLPRGYARIDMEAELVVVIGRRARSVAAADAWKHIAGYLLGNDVSCRDLQASDKQWTRAKGFDGFGPVSTFMRMVEPGSSLPVEQLEICGYLDDRLVQRGRVSAMIHSIPALIEHLCEHMTLEPGDLIFTGTPAGVSALAPGQVMRVELEGMDLGRLITRVD